MSRWRNVRFSFVGEMSRWRIVTVANCCGGEMSVFHLLANCRGGELSRWRNVALANCRFFIWWRNVALANCRGGKMSRWRIVVFLNGGEMTVFHLLAKCRGGELIGGEKSPDRFFIVNT